VSKKVFISYRREDTADAAGRVYDRLSRLLSKSNVFFDVSTISGGEDFKEKIVSAIGRSDAALIFIGREWLAPVQPTGKARKQATTCGLSCVLQWLAPSLCYRCLLPALKCRNRSNYPRTSKPSPLKTLCHFVTRVFDDDTEIIVAALLGRSARERSWENKGALWAKIAYAIVGATVSLAVIVIAALAHSSLLDRPLAASIGQPATVLVLITSLVVGVWLGLRYEARKRALR
jgi:hypothetical protein